MEKIVHTYDCQLKLEGNNEISADVLCGLLSNILIIANKTKPNEVDSLTYMIKATPPGSFLVDLAIIAESTLPPLVANGGAIIDFASNSVTILSELLKFKSFLKGKKPQKVIEKENGVEITNNYGSINIFNFPSEYAANPQIDKALTHIGNALFNSNTPSMSIRNGKNNLVQVKQDEYEYIKQPTVDESMEKTYENEFDADFVVRKPDLQGQSKWGIILNGKQINATIEDDIWLQKVKIGEVSTASNIVAKARMKVTQKIDKYGALVDGSAKYTVLKIYSYDTPIAYTQITVD